MLVKWVMKMVSLVCFSLSVAGVSAFGQDVPPAFEQKVGGGGSVGDEVVPEEHDPFDPAINAPKLVRVQVEYIEMASTDLTRLMMDDKSETADSTPLRMKVQAMVDEKKAKLFDTQIAGGRAGRKFTSESGAERIYPTEFTPTATEGKVGETMERAVASPFPVNPAIPTAFETRDLGSNLECEPTFGERNEIDLRIVTSLSWHTGNSVFHEGKDEAGNKFKLGMPGFYQMEINTSLACISGQYTLLACLSPKTVEGVVDTQRKVMVFVKCNALSVLP